MLVADGHNIDVSMEHCDGPDRHPAFRMPLPNPVFVRNRTRSLHLSSQMREREEVTQDVEARE